MLLVTAADDAETVRKALRGAVASYLIKPFSVAELQLRLEHVAAVRRRLAQLPAAPGTTPGSPQQDIDRLLTPGLTVEAEGALPKGLLARIHRRTFGWEQVVTTECPHVAGESILTRDQFTA